MTTLQSLQVILRDNLDIDPGSVSLDTKLDVLAIDSLSMIEILFAVEDAFMITVPSEPASWREKIQTVGDLVAYVDQLVSVQRVATLCDELVS